MTLTDEALDFDALDLDAEMEQLGEHRLPLRRNARSGFKLSIVMPAHNEQRTVAQESKTSIMTCGLP